MDKDQISALFFDRNVTLTQMENRIPWSRKEYQGANNRRDIYYREEELCETALNFAEYFDSGFHVFFSTDTATPEICTSLFVGSVRCV